MERHETVIVGAGHAGLAMSHHLSRLGRRHVVVERGRVAERWRSERWDSLTFQFPNWSLRLPGQAYDGDDPDGFASREQVIVAERQVALQQTELDNMIIRAPFSGVALSKDAQPGEMVSPVSAGGGFTRTGISTIVDMKSLEIEVDVNESYINRVAAGQPVTAVLDAYPDWQIAGHVITTVPTADRQ